ncbi:hypothetical protein HF992_11645 [Streptococcus ovuberis]|uniref:Phosphohexomutase n=1 Tax=Streptococcus ovuberis TaxID=1936207 RepID=A0A7X6MZS8_9STRE|nr:hypothetical protein [Streptococcus ovuberis]
MKSLTAWSAWDQLLTRVPVKSGDFFDVPAGTIHAIGKGIMILETQQSSDTTYRVYDFERTDDNGQKRELHLAKSIEVATIGPAQNSTPASLQFPGFTSTLLVSNPFFTVYKWDIAEQVTMSRTADYLLVSVLDGQGQLILEEQTYQVKKGDHFILPNDVINWTVEGRLTMIVSHPNPA